jgi:hypothetical protein
VEGRAEDTWTAPAEQGDALLWAVIHDARGGMSWRRYRVRVE